MLELNKSNFDKETKDRTIIIDFWAEWCVEPKSTFILTNNGLLKSAQNISDKDTLLNYDGKKLVADNVKKSYSSKLLGHCKEIWTETNRRIKVTDEHEFLTSNGWKQAKELKEKEKVAIMPMYTMSDESFTIEESSILNEHDVIMGLGKEISKRNQANYIKELKSKNLLPLKLNNKNLIILIRLLGCLFTDGNLYLGKSNNYREISFSLGTKEDVELLTNDLKELGFNKYHIKAQKSKVNINGRSYITNTKRVKVCSTSLWLLMKALGAPVGDKTNAEYKIPKWIMDSNYYYIKKEFLSAFMGGDGPRISIRLVKRKNKKTYNCLSLNDIEFHKNPEALEGGIKLGKQLSKLFKDLNVKISKIFVEDDNYIKKDGKKSKIIHLSFNKDFENAFNLYKNIGYRYAYTKDTESKYSTEFIRRILYKRQNWIAKYHEAIKLHKEKSYEAKKISQLLSIDSGAIWGWIKKDRKPSVNKHYEKYPTWLKNSTKNLPKNLLWEQIKLVREVYLESVQKITMKNNHNFIANGFLTHNCGPCKAMTPVFDELSREIKNIIFAKVDVDQNAEIASKFGVMSIPTFVILKNGKEVGRVIGTKSKSELKLSIEVASKK